ncbi:MAG: AAA family ATPase, partial [Bacteroidota bacterium]|nr:AAA family ATPase [Bacteroidota bacterium]
RFNAVIKDLDVDAPSYISHLFCLVTSTSSLVQTSIILIELYVKRIVLNTCYSVSNGLNGNSDISDVLDLLKTTIDESNEIFNPIGRNFRDFEVHYSDQIPEPDPILKQGDTLLMSRGDLSFIKGKAKARKSFLCSILIASFLGNESFGLKSGVSEGTVLLIDTEQSDIHVQQVQKRIHQLCGWMIDSRRLTVLALRSLNYKERKIILEDAVKGIRPDFVILDGAVDIIGDFNNAEESKQVIGLLMKLSTEYNCHICSVLHEGKGNGEMRGHLGAEALNKAETVFEVVLKNDISFVFPNATKNISFKEFRFTIDDNLPVLVHETIEQTQAEQLLEEINVRMNKILKPPRILCFTALKKEYAKCSGKSESTAKNHIKKALENSFIKFENGEYSLNMLGSHS